MASGDGTERDVAVVDPGPHRPVSSVLSFDVVFSTVTGIFLAGASGAIGRPLTAMLVAAGHEVTGTSRSADGAARIRAAGGRPVIVDVFDGPALEVAVVASRAEVVIYQVTDLALAAGETLSDERLERNALVREVGVRHIVTATAAVGARRLIAQSVAWLYLPGPEPHTEDESIVPPPPATTPRTRQAVLDLERLVTTDRRFEGVVLRYGRLVRARDVDRHPRRAADRPCRGGGERGGPGGRPGRARHLPHRQRRWAGLDREGSAAPRLEAGLSAARRARPRTPRGASRRRAWSS